MSLLPIPLVRNNPSHRYKINLPLIPESRNYFYSSPFVFYKDRQEALIISTLNDNIYRVHDNVKVVGYIVMGEYYDFKRFY